MAQSSSNFDPRELFSDVINFVRERSQSMTSSIAPAKADEAQLELAILSSLSSEAHNANAIREAVSLASGGVLNPTASQVRASLDILVEAGKVQVETKGDRKVYAITKDGKAALTEAKKLLKSDGETTESGNRKSPSWDSVFVVAASKLGPVLLDVAQTGTREQQMRAAEILSDTRHELHKILAEK